MEVISKNNIVVLKSLDFGKIRRVNVDNQNWYVRADVIKALHCRGEYVSESNKKTVQLPIKGQHRNVIIINDAGMQEMMDRSKIKNMHEFELFIGIKKNHSISNTAMETSVSNEANIQIFKNAEFGQVRTVMIEDEPWFVGKDVAEVLGYGNTKDALSRHVDADDKYQGDGVVIPDPMGRQQNPTIINESGLYSLILSSKIPTAKKFKKWVTSEILPTVRKHGVYATAPTIENMLSNPDFAIQTFTKLKSEMEARKKAEEEVAYKTKVIEGLTEDISLADKRRRITQIINRGVQNKEQYSQRWKALYHEFEMKYHINLSERCKNQHCKNKKLANNKVELIEKQLNMIPELYEVCCKLYEGDFNDIKKELENARRV